MVVIGGKAMENRLYMTMKSATRATFFELLQET